MIYDKLSNMGRYSGMAANLDRAIRYIREVQLDKLPLSKTTVDGDQVYINHFTYTTAEKEADSLFEDHAEYLDMNIITSGYERVQVQESTVLTEVERRDSEAAVMYIGEGGTSFIPTAEQFLLVYPGEAHIP